MLLSPAITPILPKTWTEIACQGNRLFLFTSGQYFLFISLSSICNSYWAFLYLSFLVRACLKIPMVLTVALEKEGCVCGAGEIQTSNLHSVPAGDAGFLGGNCVHLCYLQRFWGWGKEQAAPTWHGSMGTCVSCSTSLLSLGTWCAFLSLNLNLTFVKSKWEFISPPLLCLSSIYELQVCGEQTLSYWDRSASVHASVCV